MDPSLCSKMSASDLVLDFQRVVKWNDYLIDYFQTPYSLHALHAYGVLLTAACLVSLFIAIDVWSNKPYVV